MVPEQDQRRDTGLSGLPSHFRAGQARTSDVPLHVLVSPHRLHPIKPEPVQRAGSTVSVDGHKWTHSSDDDSIAQAPTADQHPLHAQDEARQTNTPKTRRRRSHRRSQNGAWTAKDFQEAGLS
uniref:Uncharacterized protein n=1 Tax=Craspedostauros australis TaxID=1486917 RepID=A0A7R9WSK7_9STRA|mmetsp:Transcript_18822/g.52316  ORF Transcript_18822/g.52316 Transcript_18822/m.52316 type:complete len:123 (+) Transcript_18822:317-685(+)